MLVSAALLFFMASATAQLPAAVTSVAEFAQQVKEHVVDNLEGELKPIAFPCIDSLKQIKSHLPSCLEEASGSGSRQLQCTDNCVVVFASVASLANPDCVAALPSNLAKVGKSLDSYCKSPLPEVADIIRSPDAATMKSETLDFLNNYVPSPVASLLMQPLGAFIDGLDRWNQS